MRVGIGINSVNYEVCVPISSNLVAYSFTISDDPVFFISTKSLGDFVSCFPVNHLCICAVELLGLINN